MSLGISSSTNGTGIRLHEIDLFRVWSQTNTTEARFVKVDNRVRLDGTCYLMRLLSY